MGEEVVIDENMTIIQKSNIARIIFVDDDYDDESDIATQSMVIEAIEKMNGNDSDALTLKDYGIDITDALGTLLSQEIVNEKIREYWSSSNDEARALLCNQLNVNFERLQTEEVANNLKKVASDAGVQTVDCYSVEDWTREKESLLKGNPEPTNTIVLVLFDRDLKYSKHKTVGGVTLVKEALDCTNNTLIAGIFTGEAKTADEELKKTTELSEQRQIIPVIGKFRASDATEFCRGIELFLALNAINELTSITVNAFLDMNELEGKFNEGVDYPILHEAVRSAYNEGVFLGEEILRILERIHSEKLNYLVRSEYASNLKTQLLTCLSYESLKDIFIVDKFQKRLLKHKDVYMTGDQLIHCGIPTGIGDIFEIERETNVLEYYILLSQPCGMTIRVSDSQSKRDQTDFTLVQIISGKGATTQVRSGRAFPELEPPHEGWEACYVDFGSQIHITPKLIDLCLFSGEGTAIIKKGVCRSPLTVEPGWEKRLDYLKEWVTEQYDNYLHLATTALAKTNGTEKDTILNSLISNFFHIPRQVAFRHDDNQIVVGIKRILRLRESYSHGLLIQYARYQSRPGYPAALLGRG